MKYQAEDAKFEASVSENNHKGAEGDGFVNVEGKGETAFVEWTVPSGSADSFPVEIRYALGSSPRTMAIEVNGKRLSEEVEFTGTGSWSNWDTISVKVPLGEGDNTIRLVAIGESGPNIDYLDASAIPTLEDAPVAKEAPESADVVMRWQFVDGEWQQVAVEIEKDDADESEESALDDGVIVGTDDDDALKGSSADETLRGGAGDDTIIGAGGADEAYGGTGNDDITLGDGGVFAEGGLGDDTISTGDGADVVWGDSETANVLEGSPAGAQSMAQHAANGAWSTEQDKDTGAQTMSQTVATTDGEAYDFSFEYAANLAGGKTSGTVEVLWNGEVVDTIDVTSGVFESHSVSVTGTGGKDTLSIRAVESESAKSDGPVIHTDGPVYYYDKEVEIGGETADVAAFAPGQAKLYQMISGQLKVLDIESQTYADAGDNTGLSVNAIGFNVEDDLLYGIAKKAGTDALGNPVAQSDLVMVDAKGDAFRIGEVPHADYVGDFDDQGNLWTFDGSANRATRIDVDNLDANGDPVVKSFALPKDLIDKGIADIAYSAEEGAFYTIARPDKAGEDGTIFRIDISDVDSGGEPTVQTASVSGALIDGEMESGFVKGTFGAVFLDGDGNLYAGMNSGDHDLDSSTGSSGAVYKMTIDWEAGEAYGELMAETQRTGANDGAVDPRSADAFAEVDDTATVLIRSPVMESDAGGDDEIATGAGDDTAYGGAGDDLIEGEAGEDSLFGGDGKDSLFGGDDSDSLYGGDGKDSIEGGDGDDYVEGGDGDDMIRGNDGNDTLHGQDGNDVIVGNEGDDVVYGGDGNDVLVGKEGSDTLFGGDGNERMDGGADDDSIYGGDGQDILRGGAGNDQIFGGDGADTIAVGAGDDTAYGGAGDDKLYGNGDDDVLVGGADNDKLWGYDGDDRIEGGTGNDYVGAGTGDDSVFGGDGNDRLAGRSGEDEIDGGDGNDTIDGGADDDSIDAGDGDDWAFGGTGHDTIDGGDGNDQIFGQSGDDKIDAGDGNDTAFGGGGEDTVDGGDGDDMVGGRSGNDVVSGGKGNDTVKGGGQDDTVSGGEGNDTVAGESGNDHVSGDAGNDLLVGGGGADTLIGGEGDDHMWGGNFGADGARDVFVKDAGTGTDYVHDFETKADVVDLSAYNISFDELQGAMTDVGWATEIDLSEFSGEEADRIFLKSVDQDDLDENNFNL